MQNTCLKPEIKASVDRERIIRVVNEEGEREEIVMKMVVHIQFIWHTFFILRFFFLFVPFVFGTVSVRSIPSMVCVCAR